MTIVNGEFSRPCQVTSGVPQGSILGPLLFLLFINDLPDAITSNSRLFADDCAIYLQLHQNAQASLQSDLDNLSAWSTANHLHFNTSKCKVIHITNKRTVTKFDYHLYGLPLEATCTHPYLGVNLSSDLRWNTHIDSVCKKGMRILGLLKRNLHQCSPSVKSAAYLSLVRPTLSYTSAAWDPYTLRNINKLEMIQRRAVRFVYNRYTSRDSVTALQKDLNWPSLTILRKRDRLCTMYKILNNLVAINPQSYLSFSTSVTRRKNDLKLNVFSPSVNSFKYSFFPRTVID